MTGLGTGVLRPVRTTGSAPGAVSPLVVAAAANPPALTAVTLAGGLAPTVPAPLTALLTPVTAGAADGPGRVAHRGRRGEGTGGQAPSPGKAPGASRCAEAVSSAWSTVDAGGAALRRGGPARRTVTRAVTPRSGRGDGGPPPRTCGGRRG
ncbi:hypothetical protein GCM10010266_45330 [Streptomyces griseomycini]|nr:hypothetical protein GCM10010266_45330 [Streptomyces griseomycini]GGR40813.1 hypothetical protein GCM10015536_53150 [Streptomyces griseomycini]